MIKHSHEFRDSIHAFVRMDTDERRIVDSRPFQRLRDIHQLALTYMVYPGATHRRFEHSLGVMELADRVFQVITDPHNVRPDVRERVSQISADTAELSYWRNVLRAAALCHDIGHLPFSHAAEHQLLPEGWTHERIGADVLCHEEMTGIFKQMAPQLDPRLVAKIAVGKKGAPEEEFTEWEMLLSEVIVGNAFGVDRMDYLLRDSYHTGVAYGRFDHFRLLDTLRVLIRPDTGAAALGVESGGLHAAEALLLARYFIWSQVYLHPVRRIYDIHLTEFLKSWLPGGLFPVKPQEHLQLTDVEVLSAIREHAASNASPHAALARRIAERRHFRLVYTPSPDDAKRVLEPGRAIAKALASEFGAENVRHDAYAEKGGVLDFPVLEPDGQVVSSMHRSRTLPHIPTAAVDLVFVEPALADSARQWVAKHREEILSRAQEVGGG